MALFAKEIMLGDKIVSLRLTTRNLQKYISEVGDPAAPPVVNIMMAMDSLDAKIKLLTLALSYPNNTNTIKYGEDFLDEAYDSGMGDPEIRELIVDLAQAAGVVSASEVGRIKDAIAKNCADTYDKIVALLDGTLAMPDNAAAQEPTEANPTKDARP